jgi:hypothetical protein
MQQIVQDQLDILPDDVREIVESKEWRKTVYDLGRKYALKIDELGQLEQEVYYTMIGLVPSSEFISNLVNHVHLNRDVAASLSHEIDSEVFEKIRDFIMDMDGHEAAEESEATAGSGAPAAVATQEKTDVPSREDLLKEIEEIGDGQDTPPPTPAAVPVAYSPIETSLTKPTVSTPVDLDKELSNPMAKPGSVPVAPITPEAPAAAPTPAPEAPDQAPASRPADPYRELPQ